MAHLSKKPADQSASCCHSLVDMLSGQERQVNGIIQNQGGLVYVEVEPSDVILDSCRGANAKPAVPDFGGAISRTEIPIHA